MAAVVGKNEGAGVRVSIERPTLGGPPWTYTARIETKSAELILQATLTREGEVLIENVGAHPGPEERVRLLLRAAFRQMVAREQRAPARKIVRWRAER
jgi:hypothetical protein